MSEATLRSEARVMFSFPGPRLIAAALAVAAAILAFEPFTEWLIHVYLLHFKPRTIRGRRVDPLVSRKHRAHHADA